MTRSPRFLPAVAVLFLAALLSACNPTFNWREVRPDGTRLALLLPCKPDKAEKKVPMGGTPTPLAMQGCDAGDATFAVAFADVGEAGKTADVLAQWQALTLANMKAAAPAVTPLVLPGASRAAPAVMVTAQGRRADGTAVNGQAAYFAQGSQVFQVVMYSAKPQPEAAEAFFSSLKFE